MSAFATEGVSTASDAGAATARPQMDIPGFEGRLTCCTDWPQTKRGEPPNAQSLVFSPLLACVLGSSDIEDFCTSSQLEQASRWWTEALPAWPSWVRRLRGVVSVEMREKMLRNIKGRPTYLIPKKKDSGRAPHFKGKIQREALEMDAMVSIEVDACVMCMYTQAKQKEDTVSVIDSNGSNSKALVSSCADKSLCRQFQKNGFCSRGDRCKYSHTSVVGTGHASAKGKTNREGAVGRRPCRLWERDGKCSYGDQCRFSHAALAQQGIPKEQ